MTFDTFDVNKESYNSCKVTFFIEYNQYNYKFYFKKRRRHLKSSSCRIKYYKTKDVYIVTKMRVCK